MDDFLDAESAEQKLLGYAHHGLGAVGGLNRPARVTASSVRLGRVEIVYHPPALVPPGDGPERRPVTLPPRPPDDAPAAPVPAERERYRRCKADAVRTLAEVGGRLAKKELLAEMIGRGREHSPSVLDHALAELVSDGILTNPKSGSGYGFADD